MIKVLSNDTLPQKVTKTIFLAGPTPRDKDTKSWRPEALTILKELGYDGHVFVPECQLTDDVDYDTQIDWENRALARADVIVFWVPREMKSMPALTTNVEFGLYANNGRSLFGAPPDAEKVKYLEEKAKEFSVPVFDDLAAILKKAVDIIGEGAERKDGEATVPLQIWNDANFQAWYKSLAGERWHGKTGNRLDDSKVLYTFRVGSKKDIVFLWIMWVKVWIESEKRFKENEFILSRTDISSVVMYRKAGDDTEVVLIKEFRSPVRNKDSYIYELPSGSSKGDSLTVASEEVEEETSLKIDPERFTKHLSAQLAATLSIHKSAVFSVELTEEEMDKLKKFQKDGDIFGNEEDSERTMIHVSTFGEICNSGLVDWATIGMIHCVLSGEQPAK